MNTLTATVSPANLPLFKAMQDIPFFRGYNASTKTLMLRDAFKIPDEVFGFSEHINILDASDGAMLTLPDQLPKLCNLKVLLLSNHQFLEVPPVVARCEKLEVLAFKKCRIERIAPDSLPKSLRWLILTDNELETLPQSMGGLINLRKLALAGNRLTSLPSEMAGFMKLELLRISANEFNDPPPAWLFRLPRLAWFGDAGNPYTEEYVRKPDTVPEILWSELEICYPIHESPSSIVHKGRWRREGRAVAVKLFKNGQLTSDGYPESDFLAHCAAGAHFNLVPFLGKLTQAPADAPGIVSGLLPDDFENLGGVPDFQSITRDRFDSKFSIGYIQSVIRGIASAMSALSRRNLSHGDLYAHNIMSNPRGDAYLLDFGAASFVPTGERGYERLDVRAFGYLISDLLAHSDAAEEGTALAALRNLRARCLDECVSRRPTFEEIVRLLR